MNIVIKKSIKPVKYESAISFLEKRLNDIYTKKGSELIWVLEHKEVYTAGVSYKSTELLDKSINLIETNRGGKITHHGPGQVVFYFVIDLSKRGKNIRKLISAVENTIISTLKEFKIDTFADRENIGIWHKRRSKSQTKTEKVAAIGIKVKKWIAYHGFALNVSNNLDPYKKIIPCGIKNRGVINLNKIKKQNYMTIKKELINNFLFNIRS